MWRAHLLLILALLSPAPTFTALWTGPGRAVVSWEQPPQVHLTCVYVEHVNQPPILIRCWAWLPPGGYAITLGDVAPVDGRMRPQGQDQYIVSFDGATEKAPLRSLLYLPAFV